MSSELYCIQPSTYVNGKIAIKRTNNPASPLDFTPAIDTTEFLQALEQRYPEIPYVQERKRKLINDFFLSELLADKEKAYRALGVTRDDLTTSAIPMTPPSYSRSYAGYSVTSGVNN